MRLAKPVLWIVLLGAAWGLNEVAAAGAETSRYPLVLSVWLAAWAIFVLAAGRALLPWPGSSTCIAAVAALFRLVNAEPFYCHLLGIFVLGVAFDLAATIIMKRNERNWMYCALAGVAALYVSNALFGLLMTYVFRYRFWAAEGSTKLFDHIFVSGSLAALAAILAAPLGYRIGRSGLRVAERSPAWTCAAAAVAAALLWAAGGII